MERLTSEDRAFFDLVSRAAISNPYSEQRKGLDLRIADGAPAVLYEERLDRVIQRVQERVRNRDAAGRADLRRYRGADRAMLHSAFLFDVFHYFHFTGGWP